MRKLESIHSKKAIKPIICRGRIRNFDTGTEKGRLCSNINYSEILSRLINEAGQVCRSYSSDLFISWENLLLDISKTEEENAEIIRYFGFREFGVDHEAYVKTRLSAPDCYGDHPYYSIFKLTVSLKGDRIEMKLEQLEEI